MIPKAVHPGSTKPQANDGNIKLVHKVYYGLVFRYRSLPKRLDKQEFWRNYLTARRLDH